MKKIILAFLCIFLLSCGGAQTLRIEPASSIQIGKNSVIFMVPKNWEHQYFTSDLDSFAGAEAVAYNKNQNVVIVLISATATHLKTLPRFMVAYRSTLGKHNKNFSNIETVNINNHHWKMFSAVNNDNGKKFYYYVTVAQNRFYIFIGRVQTEGYDNFIFEIANTLKVTCDDFACTR
jgi:hypothetical protein